MGLDQRGRQQKRGTLRGVQERPTGTSSITFKFFLLSFSFFFLVAFFLQSTTIGRAGWSVTNGIGVTYRSCPPWEVVLGGPVLLFFVLYVPLLFFSRFLFSDYLFS